MIHQECNVCIGDSISNPKFEWYNQWQHLVFHGEHERYLEMYKFTGGTEGGSWVNSANHLSATVIP